jgi:hypothetical protein
MLQTSALCETARYGRDHLNAGDIMMRWLATTLALLALIASFAMASIVQAGSHTPPPPEPPQEQVIEELYDNEAGLVIFTYSLNRDGVVDYVTGRKVITWKVNDYGHGVYDMERFPVFYWYDRALWRDMDSDGINGNEIIYMENVTFDRLRYR